MNKIFIVAVGLFTLNGCAYDGETPDNNPNLRPLSAAEQTVSAANNNFAFNLFQTIRNNSDGSNVFISPLSVTTALAMTMNGACDSTQQSILKVLKFGNYSPQQVDQACKDLTSLLTSMDRTVSLGLANSVWSNQRYSVRDSFATTIKNYFDGTVQGLNFSDPNSAKHINSWIESKTNHLIKNMIESTTEDEAMLLVNAIYFKGDWSYQFDASKTHSAPFYREDGSSQNVTTMFSKETTVSYFTNSTFELIDIPYGNKQFTMTVLMPYTKHSINEILQQVTADSLNHWLSQTQSTTTQLEIPKFKMSWKKELLGSLINMGMQTSGFPRLFKENLPLQISGVLHQSLIDVNEEGTEAAAATVVTMLVSSAPPKLTQINRPFLYMIREKHSNTILFMGQMMMPSDL
ncbi:MAG: serpin family protein [Bacteroidetes bacterium]|nr:serpin family protein [Bacteroidota bacterium]